MRSKFTLRRLLIDMVVLSLLMALGVNAYRHGPNSGIPFDVVKWNEQGHSRDRNRIRMVDDLVKNHLPVGMKESDVIALLGDPGGSGSLYRRWLLLDQGRLYGELVIRFDQQRRIEVAYTFQD